MDKNYVAARSTSLRHFLMVVFKRIWLVAGISVLALLAGAFQIMRLPDKYEASAKLLLERDPELEKMMLLRISGGGRDDESSYSFTQESEIMTSRPVLERVILGLGLFGFDDTTKFLNSQDREAAMQNALFQMSKDLSIIPSTDPNIVKVKFKSTDPARSAGVVNDLVNKYIEYRFEVFSDDQNLAFLDKQIEETGSLLTDLQNQRALFQSEGTLYTPAREGDILFTKLKDYESRADALKLERISKEAKLKSLQDMVNNGTFDGLAAIDLGANNSQMVNVLTLKSQLWTLEYERDRLRQKYTDTYVEVQEKTTEIEALRKRINEEVGQIIKGLQSHISALNSEESTLRANVASIQYQIRGLSGKDLEMSKLSRSILETEEIYSALQKQRDETRLSRTKKEMVVRVKVISAAVPPLEPISEHKFIKLALVLCLGIFAGISMAFFFDFFDHSFQSAEDVQRYLNLDVLASIRSFEKP
jgi:uncharacterized protein involved in exopolysaccharide biosynthesis